jgi:pilus assembly protein CpaF
MGASMRFDLSKNKESNAGSAESPKQASDVIVDGDRARIVDVPIASEKAHPNVDSSSEIFGAQSLEHLIKLQNQIIDDFNLNNLDKMPVGVVRQQIKTVATDYAHRENLVLNQNEVESLVSRILDEMNGLGPLEPLLRDPTVNDILINGHEKVFVERGGKLRPTSVRFNDEAHLLRVIYKIVSSVGRRVDESSPLCDCRLLDGSRVNIAIRPIAIDGPLVSIRKFAKQKISMDRLVELGAIPQAMAELLEIAARGRISMLISGGTGSGKTTMLNALSNYIPHDERLVTIEDAAELQLQQPHVARMETRPPNAEGKGEIKMRDLVKNALRMRPDRIIVGECRGGEAFDMLQAMNTGHEGSMTTIHANTPRDAVRRMENMVGMAGLGLSMRAIRQQIASAVQLILQLQRQSDGKRKVVSLTEITGMEGEVVQMQEIFRYVREGVGESGNVIGSFQPTGLRPAFLVRLKAMGLEVPSSYFESSSTL